MVGTFDNMPNIGNNSLQVSDLNDDIPITFATTSDGLFWIVFIIFCCTSLFPIYQCLPESWRRRKSMYILWNHIGLSSMLVVILGFGLQDYSNLMITKLFLSSFFALSAMWSMLHVTDGRMGIIVMIALSALIPILLLILLCMLDVTESDINDNVGRKVLMYVQGENKIEEHTGWMMNILVTVVLSFVLFRALKKRMTEMNNMNVQMKHDVNGETQALLSDVRISN